MAEVYLYNSLTRKKEKFTSIKPMSVGMYTCGMTVYDLAHIGHGRKYVGDDILRRTLELNGYKVSHVQNVTDVGHLTSDADEGEDKLEKGAKKFGKNVWEVADFFTNDFYKSMDKLNIVRPSIISRATEHIKEQIELVKKLVEKGFAYDTPEAVYFETEKFKEYGQLFGQKLSEKKIAVRKEVKTGTHKKSPYDFVLWFKRVGRFKNHTMHWDSPWGDGFPGWHIECSAMSMKYLGEQFDIHTGGEDHIPIHHPNEIAQSEGSSGKSPFVRFWIHHAFLKVEGKKMSKSLGNLYTISDIEKRGFDPLSLRYLFLTAHYRDPLNFTWESLGASQKAYQNLRDTLSTIKADKSRVSLSREKQVSIDFLRNEFLQAVNDDLNTPKALAVLWEVLKSSLQFSDKYDLVLYFDEVLGLKLSEISKIEYQVPNAVKELASTREKLRDEGKFEKADQIRKKIKDLGFIIEDTDAGPKLKPAENV